MGAHNLHMITDVPEAELETWFSNLQADYRSEYGTDPYNGTWSTMSGICVDKRRTFHQENLANKYVLDNTEKRGPALAVPLQLRVDVPWLKSKAYERAGAKLQAARTAHAAFPRTVLERVRSQKSKLKGCSACGSRISIAHIHHMRCPVCNDANFLMTATDRARYKRLEEKLSAAEAAILEAEVAYNKTGKTKAYWAIGGWATT